MRSIDDDRTAKAKIRDAAITCFAAEGVAGTSVRTIADVAGVSPGLVIHHFGSKDGLRVACDQYIANRMREQKSKAMTQGPGLDPLASMRGAFDGPPLVRYLAKTMVDSSPHVAELIDEMVDDAVVYIEAGVQAGLITPSEHPRRRAALLTLWALGGVVLHEHMERLLGVDITADLSDDPASASAYVTASVDVLGGFITDTFKELWANALTTIENEKRESA